MRPTRAAVRSCCNRRIGGKGALIACGGAKRRRSLSRWVELQARIACPRLPMMMLVPELGAVPTHAAEDVVDQG
jgi:hypothetical protein